MEQKSDMMDICNKESDMIDLSKENIRYVSYV